MKKTIMVAERLIAQKSRVSPVRPRGGGGVNVLIGCLRGESLSLGGYGLADDPRRLLSVITRPRVCSLAGLIKSTTRLR